jgi:hypothetical protein
LAREIVTHAATSEALAKAAPSQQMSVILERIVAEEGDWTPDRIQFTGAALERVGFWSQALGFYESVWKRPRRIPAPARVIEYCQARWCRCKYRMAERFTSQARKAEAEQQRAEADSLLLTLGMRIEQVPEYPALVRPSAMQFHEDRTQDQSAQTDAVLALAQLGPDWTTERIAAAVQLAASDVEEILNARRVSKATLSE